MEHKIDFNKLVYVYSDSNKNYPTGFRNYRKQQKLFEDLRHGEVNPREVLKNQEIFKSGMHDIKIGKKIQQKISINFLI